MVDRLGKARKRFSVASLLSREQDEVPVMGDDSSSDLDVAVPCNLCLKPGSCGSLRSNMCRFVSELRLFFHWSSELMLLSELLPAGT